MDTMVAEFAKYIENATGKQWDPAKKCVQYVSISV